MLFCLIRSIRLVGVTIPSSETLALQGKTVFDIAAGFLFITGRFSGGFSVSHLAEPDLSTSGVSNERLKRKVLVHLSGDFYLNEAQNLKIQPLTYLGFQRGYLIVGAGAALESKYLSVNAICLRDNAENLNIQTGFAYKGRQNIYLL